MSYSDVGGAITSFQCLFASNKYVKKTLRAPTTECFSLSRISVVTRLYWITDSLIVHYSVPKLFELMIIFDLTITLGRLALFFC